MKVTLRFSRGKAYIALVVVIAIMLFPLFNGCKKETVKVVPTITVATMTNITATTATCGGAITSDGGAVITASGVCWSTSQNPTTANSKTNDGIGSGSFTSSITGLAPNTTYYVRAYATNSVGTAYGSTISFTTSGIIPEVSTSEASKILETGATLNGSLKANALPMTSIVFEYGLTTSYGSIIVVAATTVKNDTIIAIDLNQLTAATTYHFRIKAVNSIGYNYGLDKTFTTLDPTVVDYDGNVYHLVTIGAQVWLKENFKGTHYANGDSIPNVTDPTTWENLTAGAYCWYNNDAANGVIYGGLYNFYVGADPRGLITGWHVPDVYELADLMNYLGGSQPAGAKMIGVNPNYWNPAPLVASVLIPFINSSGFTALPNGVFEIEQTTKKFAFQGLGETATFWSSSLFGPGAVISYINGSNALFTPTGIDQQTIGLGIRLVKNVN